MKKCGEAHFPNNCMHTEMAAPGSFRCPAIPHLHQSSPLSWHEFSYVRSLIQAVPSGTGTQRWSWFLFSGGSRTNASCSSLCEGLCHFGGPLSGLQGPLHGVGFVMPGPCTRVKATHWPLCPQELLSCRGFSCLCGSGEGRAEVGEVTQ